MSEIVSLQEVYELTDFATDNLWYMSFITMPKLPGISITAKELNLRCQKFTVPTTSIQYVDFKLHNHDKHQPVVTKQPAEISIPLIETKDMKSSKFLTAWREVCCKSNTNYVSDPLARRAEIQFYHFGNQHEIIYTYKIKYVEFKDAGSIEYGDGSSPGVVVRNANLVCGAVYEGQGI